MSGHHFLLAALAVSSQVPPPPSPLPALRRVRPAPASRTRLRSPSSANETPARPPKKKKRVTWATMSPAEEAEYVRRFKAGDATAGDILVRAHMGAIVKHALRYRGRGVENADLVQDGCIGFLKGLEHFDLARGVRVITYVTYWVRHDAGRAADDHGQTVRVPVHVHKKLDEARKKGLESPEEIDAAGILGEKYVRCALGAGRPVVSTDTPVYQDNEEGMTVCDTLPAEGLTPDVAYEEASERASMRALVQRVVATLPAREQFVLRHRFLVPAGEVLTRLEVADRMGVSRERVRQIEVKALATVRRVARDEGMADEGMAD